jgi:hypothetical protein
MPEDKTVIARRKQSEADKSATLDKLLSKRRATTTFSVLINDEELELTFQSIGAAAYDKLVAKNPPTPSQRVDGASFNMDTFAPALISACSVEPEISPADAKAIWESEDWSRGELMVLFRNAVEINNKGFDIPFNETD